MAFLYNISSNQNLKTKSKSEGIGAAEPVLAMMYNASHSQSRYDNYERESERERERRGKRGLEGLVYGGFSIRCNDLASSTTKVPSL